MAAASLAVPLVDGIAKVLTASHSPFFVDGKPGAFPDGPATHRPTTAVHKTASTDRFTVRVIVSLSHYV